MRKDLLVAALFLIPGVVIGIAIDRYWLIYGNLSIGAAGAQPLSASTPAASPRRDALLDKFDTRNLRAPIEEIHAGGPDKDGIPSLTAPKTAPVSDADFLKPGDRVVGVTFNGQSRAYPINVLSYHEAINDTVGGVPVAIVYCPLCDSVSVVDRRIDDKTLEFGISGLLWNSNVLLYDRIDDALWSQVRLEAVSGPLAGRPLTHLPFALVPFSTWAKDHPDGTVMTYETGHARAYGANPYANRGYFSNDELWFPISGRDDRLPVKERIVGVRLGDVTRAYPVKVIAALPGGELTDAIAGRSINLRADAGGGVTVTTVPEGAQVVHTFWFTWASFHPATEIYSPAASQPAIP